MATPLIQSLSNKGGTLYTFSSAIQQQAIANSDDTKFEFSKFVALDLPLIKKPVFKENFIQFNQIDGQIFDGLSAYNSINLIQSFQNYALNLETLFLNSASYDNTTLKTVSERVFFKWLKEIGAIRFKSASETETSLNRFTEEEPISVGDTRYSKVVKYIGDIDIVNNVKHKGNSFTEVYMYIPSEAGSTPSILFEALEDANYKPDLIIKGSSENIYDRDDSTIHPEGLSISAYYDYDSSVDYQNSENANWYNQAPILGSTNSYFTEPTTFSDASNIPITKLHSDYPGSENFSDITYLRSRLDGISIDFEPSSYLAISNNASINNIQELNSSDSSSDFEFNAVLIYYDIYEEGNQSIRETNLYGVLFLDNLVENLGESYIPSFPKYKFNKILNKNGNSFGLRLNLRNNQSVSGSSVENIVNEYNTFSMGLFSETMVQLQKSLVNFSRQDTKLIELYERLDSLESLMYGISDINKLNIELTNLKQDFDKYKVSFSETSTLLDLISTVNYKLNSLINNNTSLEVSYNTDVIQNGLGISIDKSVPNVVKLNNVSQYYSMPVLTNKDNTVIDIDNKYTFETVLPTIKAIIKDFTNYIKIHIVEGSSLKTDFKIVLNDKDVVLRNGQSFRISFSNNVLFNAYSIRIYSDYYNKFGFGELNKIVLNIDSSELSSKPLIEIICKDAATYSFDYEILR